MSIRIQNDGVASAATSLPAPVESVTAEKSGSSSFTGSVGSSGGDQVDISSLSGNITESSNALAAQGAARVSQLAALYSKGEYQVDSMQLSQSLVAGAISGSVAAGSFGGDN
jgi:hypothetical protein